MGNNEFVLEKVREESEEYKDVMNNFTEDAGNSFEHIYQVRSVNRIKL